LLIKEQLLSQPILYLSAYFERNRDEYYRLLLSVSQRGTWREWVEYFLQGVADESKDAILRANSVIDLWTDYRQKLQNERHSVSTLTLLDEIIKNPVMTYKKAENVLGFTNRAARQNVDKLVEIGLLQEVTERERYKIFVAPEIISILEGVELW
jgi:Fic family protein